MRPVSIVRLLPLLIASFALSAVIVCPVLAQNGPAPGRSASLVPSLIREAMTAADAVIDPIAKSRALTAGGKARGIAANLPGAKQSFTAAKLSAQKIADPQDRANVLKEIAIAQASVKDAGAKQTFQDSLSAIADIKDVGAQIGTMASIARAQRKAGDIPGGKTTFETAVQNTETVSDIPTRTFALCSIADAMQDAGETALAALTAQAAQDTCSQFSGGGANNERYWRDRMRGLAVVGLLTRLGKLTEAQAMTDGIQDDYMKSSALWAIATAQARAKDIASAKATIGRITNGYLKATATSNVASLQAQAGDITGALQMVPEITDPFRKAEAVSAIAQAQGKAGDVELARTTAAQVTDDNLKAEAFSWIAVAQAKSGAVEAARQAASQMEQPYWRAVTLCRIVETILSPAR